MTPAMGFFLEMKKALRLLGRAYICGMDETIYRALAGGLGVLFWGYMWDLSDRIADRRARRNGDRPHEPSQAVYRLGVKLGRLFGKLCR